MILEITGQSALSKFRLSKLLASIKKRDPHIQSIQAGYIYFAKLASQLSSGDKRKLEALLLSGESPAVLVESAQKFLVIPRLGTISPWSSKATDIVHACGLKSIERIERGICYAVMSEQNITDEVPYGVGSEFHDRMTESLLTNNQSVGALFETHSPKELSSIVISKNAMTSLHKANEDLGLALSTDEIEYLHEYYLRLERNPTDVELMMFAQANSEHCRHKTFRADWVIDGEAQEEKLFDMIKSTTHLSPEGIISAYSDNAAVIEGFKGKRLLPSTQERRFEYSEEPIQILMKVETHNHPTAISPFQGASTGSGGEIRDEGATGLGAKPKAGLTGFTVSHLRIPEYSQPWEQPFGHSNRISTPLEIMLEGPIGGAAFNNEFGRPNLLGYFRTYEAKLPFLPDNEIRGYHKPIMIAGGLGNIRAEHALKIEVAVGANIIVIGGPAMLIGLGGGAASSLASGTSSEDLDYASVQRGNPEIQRRAQEVIDRCSAMGLESPITLIHDVGAGGLSNAVPETVDHSKRGAEIELRDVPNAELGMSPMEIWCNEAQERYVLIIPEDRTDEFVSICDRERCPFAIIGKLSDDGDIRVNDSHFDNKAVDIPMELLFGKPPKMIREVTRVESKFSDLDLTGIDLEHSIFQILKFPAVSNKTFLIHIGDRTVGGLCVRDQMVGPWQTPVSDVAITATSYESVTGEAMAMGERTPLAIVNAAASGRMAVGEAITNIAAASITDIRKVRLSANWMAAIGHPGEDANLFDTVKAVSELCRSLGIAIPVGKDSLSMQTQWEQEGKEYKVIAPVSLIVSAFAPVTNVRQHLTPQLQRINEGSQLLLLDLGEGANRLGGSCLSQVYGLSGGNVPDINSPKLLNDFFSLIQTLSNKGLLLSYHDRSDGGLFVSVAEMMFAGHMGVSMQLHGSNEDILSLLFNEELGAIIQIADSKLAEVKNIIDEFGISWLHIGNVEADEQLSISRDNEIILQIDRVTLQQAWSETTFHMQSLRDNPVTAKEEFDRILDTDDPGLNSQLTFNIPTENSFPRIGGKKPKVAILREQGVNSHFEMAAAFIRAGFDAFDVHMSDLLEDRDNLNEYDGFAACGGFSFGDVLGAGGGWAKSILYHSILRDQFVSFFERSNSFALGVCNGCQMLSHLKELIPGAEHWPQFLRNRSEQFEARFNLVEIQNSQSLFLSGMAGSRIPIATSHGEGRVKFENDDIKSLANPLVTLKYVDNYGRPAQTYPENPNGSIDGICGLTTIDGRVTIMMPHPERVVRTTQNSWHPKDWEDNGPWINIFLNARKFIK